jgi:hypothetical protein
MPVRLIGAVAAAALVLGLVLGGGVAYFSWRPVGSPVVANERPAQPDTTRDGPAIEKQPDAPLFGHGREPNRTFDGPTPQKQPNPHLVARLRDPQRVPDVEPTEKQPELQLALAAEVRMQANVPPGGQAAQKQRWEYLVITVPADTKNATDQLNRLAGDGWEYLSLINTSIPGTSGVFEPHQNRIVGASGGHESSILLRRLKIPFKVEGAIEAETMKIAAKSADFSIQIQDTTPFPRGQWSSDRQLFARPLRAGDWTDLELPAPAQGKYLITVYLGRSWDYGVIRFGVNGIAIGKPIDGFHADTVVTTGAIDLGPVNLKEGVNTLRVEVVGSNRNSAPPHFSWGLDCMVLKQVD